MAPSEKFSKLYHKYKIYFLAFISGCLIYLVFSPYNFHIVLLIPFSYLIYVYSKIKAKESIFVGFAFGFGMFGSSVSWIYISIHEYGHIHSIISIMITLAFIFTLSTFTAIHGYFVNKFYHKNYILNSIIFSSIWTILEWLRGWILTGFPWLYIGYSQVETIYGGFLPIVGVFGTTFIVILICCLIFGIIRNIKSFRKVIAGIVIISLVTILSCFLAEYKWTHKISNPITVSLIQSNIDQNIKWNRSNLESTLQLFFDLTNSNIDSNLVIWPESSIPLTKQHAHNFLDQIDNLAKNNSTGVLLGILINKDNKIYNGLIGIGNSNGQYLKQFLVPLGEFIPFKETLGKLIQALNFPLGDLHHGTSDQNNLVYNGIKIAPFICYEIAYAKSFLDFRRTAQLFLTVSNDAWFGESVALDQHLQIAQARAKQSGKYHLVSTNTGITAVINNHGKIISKAKPFEITVLNSTIYPMEGLTPWSKIGYMPIILFLFIFTLVPILVQNYLEKSGKKGTFTPRTFR
ncbi:MAG: apolipoprotein N-acyltransferase [Legionellales bacterium]|nr:apolipoprotein N-acyltransferase [Legionellales bacterium]